jgi:DNA-binding response OmpR family regulator
MARILVADDHPLVRKAVSDILLGAGHDVVLVANGREAEAAVGDDPPDLVLLDILMPEKDGIETILSLRRQYPDLRILAMSAGSFGHTDFLAAAAKFGADVLLRKPFDGVELVAAVDALLARASAAPRPSAGRR